MFELKEREQLIRLRFTDDTIQVDVSEQRQSDKGKLYYVSTTIEDGSFHNAIDFHCDTLENAKKVAKASYEFMKTMKPLVSVNTDKSDD